MGAFSDHEIKRKRDMMANCFAFLVPPQSSPSGGSVVAGPTYWTPANYASSPITMGIDDYASGAPADGTEVETLLDRWGGGVNGIAATGVGPLYKTGVFGATGGGAFLFDGSPNPVYAIPGAPLQSSHTWIAVIKWTSISGNDYSAAGNYVNTAMNGPSNSGLANIHYRTPGYASYPAQAGAGISFDGVDNGGHTLNAWHVIILPFNMTTGQASTMRIDGYSYPLGSTFTSMPANLTRVLLMGDATNGASAGYLRSQFIIPGILSLSDIQKFEGYYANLGGFNGNLKSDHPYLATPPTV